MAHISHVGPFCHLRAEPNQFVLHYRNGRLVRSGAGLAYWFSRLSAAVAQVPVEDCETTFLLQERSADLQDVAVQCTLTYRCSDPERTASRVNFTISLDTGFWTEQPLQRLASLWSQRAQQPTRAYLMGVVVQEAVRSGAELIRAAVDQALRGDPDISAMGLTVVTVQINRVTPTAELEKALQTPTREGIQQKADEAVFQRRATAVEKERAIKENELATEIELARQQEHLIRQQGSNQLLKVQGDAEAEKARVEAEVAREEIAAEGYARDVSLRARGDALARKQLAEVETEAEAARLAVWQQAPPRVALGLALQQFASKVQNIQHLNLTPDLLTEVLQSFLREQAER